MEWNKKEELLAANKRKPLIHEKRKKKIEGKCRRIKTKYA